MPYPFYTKTRLEKQEKQVLPSPLHKQQADPAGYIPDDGLIGAVNAALLLGQPLLLTGE